MEADFKRWHVWRSRKKHTSHNIPHKKNQQLLLHRPKTRHSEVQWKKRVCVCVCVWWVFYAVRFGWFEEHLFFLTQLLEPSQRNQVWTLTSVSDPRRGRCVLESLGPTKSLYGALKHGGPGAKVSHLFQPPPWPNPFFYISEYTSSTFFLSRERTNIDVICVFFLRLQNKTY